MLLLPPTTSDVPGWIRKAAGVINGLLRGQVFPPHATAPEQPTPGQTYFDTATGKARCWDGTSWNDLW